MSAAPLSEATLPPHAAPRRARLPVLALAARYPAGAAGALLLALVVAAALLAPVIAPHPIDERVGEPYAPPSASHPLGLDDGGIDIVTLLLWGARTSLLVGFGAALIAAAVGLVVGVAAGYFGGLTDSLLMRVTDYFLVIPTLPLMIVVGALWGSSVIAMILMIAALSWTMTARVLRSQILTLRERVFVRRARSLGAGHGWILGRHILPHVAPLLLANVALTVGSAIFFESALTFLGLGDPSAESWGRMIANAYRTAAVSEGAWTAIVTPGVCIAGVILACSLVGRAIETALNPRIDVSYVSRQRFKRRAVPGQRTEAA